MAQRGCFFLHQAASKHFSDRVGVKSERPYLLKKNKEKGHKS